MSRKLNAVVISASPKTSGMITSKEFARLAAEKLEGKKAAASCIDVRTTMRERSCDDAFAKMSEADALLFVFPLYYFCLPGMLMQFLQDYTAAAKSKKGQRVWCIVNCGFHEPEINDEAVRVIEVFSRYIGAEFRFGITVACGSVVAFMRGKRFMRKTDAAMDAALEALADDVCGEGHKPTELLRVKAGMPRGFYYFMAGMGWKRMAKKNGLKIKALYDRPYAQN